MIIQPDLFSQAPAQRHSSTSREAARLIDPTANKLRQRVFDCIREHQPVTDERIAELTGLNPSTARPRRIELVQAGLIRAGGVSRKTRSGRNAVAWVVA